MNGSKRWKMSRKLDRKWNSRFSESTLKIRRLVCPRAPRSMTNQLLRQKFILQRPVAAWHRSASWQISAVLRNPATVILKAKDRTLRECLLEILAVDDVF